MAATNSALAQSADDWRSRSIVDEIRLGLFGHHIEPSGTEQGGLDVNAEILFAKPVSVQDRGSLHSFLMPRIHIGAQINVDGDTSQLYAGFTWDLRVHERFSFEVTFGGAVHDGPTNGEGSSFGCVANFREVGIDRRRPDRAPVALRNGGAYVERGLVRPQQRPHQRRSPPRLHLQLIRIPGQAPRTKSKARRAGALPAAGSPQAIDRSASHGKSVALRSR